MAKKRCVGTITGLFDSALDGITARLVRRRKLGYTVELLESKNTFHKGDIVHLSPAEFLIPHNRPHELTLEAREHHSSESI
jgi:hypothetical protein